MRERMIERVVEILREEGDNLSDGYDRCYGPVDDTPRRIAERIIDSTEEEWQR